MKLLLLGATGLVGSRTLQLALSHDAFSCVIAPTRAPLAPAGKLVNPVGANLLPLVPDLLRHQPDALVCALGTTRAKAGSKPAFRHVDYELPLAVGRAAHAAGVQTCAIVTAMGAAAHSPSFYYRTKGELERDLRRIGFRSLTICRPSLIGGERNEARHETRTAERAALALLRRLAPIVPQAWQVNPAEAIAASLIEAVITAQVGCRWIRSNELTG